MTYAINGVQETALTTLHPLVHFSCCFVLQQRCPALISIQETMLKKQKEQCETTQAITTF